MQAIYDAENNINLSRYSNIDGLKKDLGMVTLCLMLF